MTLEEFMRGQGYQYQARDPWDDSVMAGWRPLSETELQNAAITDFAGRPEDYADRAAQYYDRFGGDFGKLAQMAGYQGSNPAAFLMGVENVQGQRVPFGEWATQANPLAGMNDAGFMPIGMTQQIQDWALPQLAALGISPLDYAAGAKQHKTSLGDIFANVVRTVGTGAIGGAALGMGPLAEASGTAGSGGIFGSSAPWATGADASWGVNPVSSNSSLELGGEAPWWESLPTSTPDPMSQIYGPIPSAASGGFNVADFIKNGTINGAPGVAPPAIPGMGNGVGLTEAALAGLKGASGTALTRILNGDASDADWLEALGTVGSTGLGLYGANQQSGAFADLANKGWEMGAPSRARFEGSFAPDFDLLKADPLLQGGLDTAANTAARAWSAKAGNPADSPTAQAEIQKYLLGSVYLPQGNAYRSQNMTAGQLGTNLAGTATGAGINAEGGMYDALGYGLGQLTKPKNPYEDMMKGLMGGFKLNTGTSW